MGLEIGRVEIRLALSNIGGRDLSVFREGTRVSRFQACRFAVSDIGSHFVPKYTGGLLSQNPPP